MAEWVTQSEAVRLLASMGDSISQPALSQYLSGHPEVPRQAGGPGKPTMIDFAALKRSRETRGSRGPASQPTLDLAEPVADAPEPADEELEPQAHGGALIRRHAPRDPLAERKAEADTARAEFDARRARILAEEAEGSLIRREVAAGAMMAAASSLLQALELNRRSLVEDLRAAPDLRAADLVMKDYERRLRAALASDLTEVAQLADPQLALAAQ